MPENNNIMLSGGAQGADLCWGQNALLHGHDVIHFSFDGHKTQAPKDTILRLSSNELDEATEPLKLANKKLQRALVRGKPWIYNLLSRNWFQVREAESLYAVGQLNNQAIVRDLSEFLLGPEIFFDKAQELLGVQGGTSWAIQMFYDRNIDGNIYFYDQENNKILLTNPSKYCFWINIGYLANNKLCFYSNEFKIPKPYGTYAAIGSRKLSDNGKIFIEAVFNQ